MGEREERGAPEVGDGSRLGMQAVGGKSAHTESNTEANEDQGTGSALTPHLHLPMPDLQLLRLDHAPALLAFERENRAYFAASVPDRGDEFFAEFDAQYAQLLTWQAAGTDYSHLLVQASPILPLRAPVTQHIRVNPNTMLAAVTRIMLVGKLP